MSVVVKNPSANAVDIRDMGSISGLKDPLEEGKATHLPGEPQGQSSLVDYSLQGRKEFSSVQSLSRA